MHESSGLLKDMFSLSLLVRCARIGSSPLVVPFLLALRLDKEAAQQLLQTVSTKNASPFPHREGSLAMRDTQSRPINSCSIHK
jgi:hypothetical protein